MTCHVVNAALALAAGRAAETPPQRLMKPGAVCRLDAGVTVILPMTLSRSHARTEANAVLMTSDRVGARAALGVVGGTSESREVARTLKTYQFRKFRLCSFCATQSSRAVKFG